MSLLAPERSLARGLAWAFITAAVVCVLLPIALTYVLIIGVLRRAFGVVLPEGLLQRTRRAYNFISTPVHTGMWTLLYYRLHKGLYHLLETPWVEPWMGVDLRGIGTEAEYLASLSKNTRRRLTGTLNRTIRQGGFERRRYSGRALQRLLLSPKHWALTFRCDLRRNNDDYVMACLAMLRQYCCSIFYPLDCIEYYQGTRLVAYLVCGMKGRTYILSECVIDESVTDFMIYHHMINQGVKEAIELELDFVNAGFGAWQSKKMAGLVSYEEFAQDQRADFRGFSLKPFVATENLLGSTSPRAETPTCRQSRLLAQRP